ncbi:MAG: DUF1579 domain-containing protein [Aureliella sp.]
MRKFLAASLLFAISVCAASQSVGQEMALPKPGPEMDVLKSDVGTWDVVIKAWDGPGEPTVSKGTETNRMLGGFWLVVEFEGNMFGLDFEGRGSYSYDSEKKAYVGTWIDSLSPYKMELVGKYDKERKTLTYSGVAPGPDGEPAQQVMTTKYNDDGSHVMTLQTKVGQQLVKVFEMHYTKKAAKVK